ncbi:MAG: glycosyltransferase [Deltaproteobacteria bacterium]|nr:glycosyltransferase [Deltaproteobacteria bacterium]
MRVLMLLATSSVTGPAELCLDDAKGLRKAGHEVLFGLDTERPGNYAQTIQDAGFEALSQLALSRKSSPLEIARDIARLRRCATSADLVHCRFAHDHAIAMVALKRLKGRPALVRTAETARSARSGWLRSLAFKASDAVIAPCQEYARQLKDVHGLTSDVVHVLAGRVDPRRFSPGDGSSMRALWGWARARCSSESSRGSSPIGGTSSSSEPSREWRFRSRRRSWSWSGAASTSRRCGRWCRGSGSRDASSSGATGRVRSWSPPIVPWT